jgi:hypothetical protein
MILRSERQMHTSNLGVVFRSNPKRRVPFPGSETNGLAGVIELFGATEGCESGEVKGYDAFELGWRNGEEDVIEHGFDRNFG